MALKLFRQNLGKLKWTLYLVIFALGGSMVLLFVDPPGSPAGTSLSGRQVARVGDFTISGSETKAAMTMLDRSHRKNSQ